MLLRDKIIENISLDKHALAELRKLGYPYAVKNRSLGAPLHTPEYQVHKQSGRLLKAIRLEETPDGFRVGIDERLAPEIKYLIYGTSTMIARDFITGSFNEVKEEISRILGGQKNYEVENYVTDERSKAFFAEREIE